MKVRTETDQLPEDYKITDVIPYGYILNPENHQDLLIDEEVAVYVRFIFDEYQRGAKIADITKILSSIGAPSPVRQKQKHGCTYLADRRADYWIDGHVNRILRHEIYTGRLPYIQRKRSLLDQELEKRDTGIYPNKALPTSTGRVLNHHPAYITLEQHLKIIERLAAEGTRYTRHVTKRYDSPIFAGHIYCGTCNRPMRFCRAFQNGVHIYDYYCCSSKLHRVINPCPQTRYKVDWIKEEVWKTLYEEHLLAGSIYQKTKNFLTDDTYQRYDQILSNAITRVVEQLQRKVTEEQNLCNDDVLPSSDLSLEEKLTKLIEERMKLRNIYAANNLWVSLYANVPDDSDIDYDLIRKYIAKILVFQDKHIEVKFRRLNHKKQILPYLDPENAIDFVDQLKI